MRLRSLQLWFRDFLAGLIYPLTKVVKGLRMPHFLYMLLFSLKVGCELSRLFHIVCFLALKSLTENGLPRYELIPHQGWFLACGVPTLVGALARLVN